MCIFRSSCFPLSRGYSHRRDFDLNLLPHSPQEKRAATENSKYSVFVPPAWTFTDDWLVGLAPPAVSSVPLSWLQRSVYAYLTDFCLHGNNPTKTTQLHICFASTAAHSWSTSIRSTIWLRCDKVLTTSMNVSVMSRHCWNMFALPVLTLDRFVQKHIYIRKSSFLESQKQPQKQLQKEPKNSCLFDFFRASKKLQKVVIFRSFLILF